MPRAFMVSLVFLCSTAFGQSTWTGAVSSNWGTPGNWLGAVPTAGTDAIIPSGTSNSPSTNGVAGAGCRDLTVSSGAALSIVSGFQLSVSRNVTADGTISGTGPLRLVGTTPMNIGGAGSIGALEVAKVTGTAGLQTNLTVTSLTLVSGTFTVSNGGNFTMTVGGNAQFQGGTLQANFVGILDIAGNVTFSGTSAVSPPTIRCGGNWSSDANFAPTSGTVVFDRSGSQTISGPGNFVNVAVAAGSSTSASGGVHAAGTLDVAGSLTVSPGALDADGFVTVLAAGTLTLGNTTNTFGAGLTVLGGFVAGGTIVFDGAAAATISSVAGLPGVQISKTGAAISVDSNLSISGNLTQTSGTLTVSNGGIQTVSVAGNAQFQGGTLQSNFQGIVDVAGNVTFSGTSVTLQTPTIRCGGNWSSDANFAPSTGLVVLDKTGSQTISAAGTFPSLTVQAGSNSSSSASMTTLGVLTVAGSLTVPSLTTGALTVSGSATVSPGALDANGAVTVSAGGTLTLGTGTNTFGSDLIVGGALLGSGSTGTIVFDGSAAGIVASVVPLPNVQIAKAPGGSVALAGDVTVPGNLTLMSGTFLVSNGGNFTMTVGGNAQFQGGTLQANFVGILDIAGNVTFSGTSAVSPPTIRCGGNWSSDANFAPTSGTVVFNRTGAQTISGPGNFVNLAIATGSSTSASGGVHAAGTLDVAGSLTVSPGALDVDGFVTVLAAGTLTLGNTTTTFGAGLTVLGGLVAGGTIVFDGAAAATISSVAGLPGVQISKTGAAISVDSNLSISGNLTQTSGTLTVSNNGIQTVSVAGNAQFQGGTLQSNFQGIVDVAGNVTFSGTSVTSQTPTIRCGGNWSSDANFAPSTGLVVLDKTGSQTISAAGPFPSLTVQAGSNSSSSASVTALGTLTVAGSLIVSGSLTTGALTVSGSATVSPGALDANGAVAVGAGATLTLGTATNTFGSDLIVDGALLGSGSTGTIVFDGSAPASVASVVPLPNVQIAKASGGSLGLIGNVTVAGNLTLMSGTFLVSNGGNFTMTVAGNAQFQGGTLQANFIGILDIAGNVTFSGTSAVSPPTIRCGGNWSSDANFAPTTGTVVLRGTASTTIAHATPGGTISFPTLVIDNGQRSPANDFTIASSAMTVTATGGLAVNGGHHLRIHRPAGPTPIVVDGGLSVATNSELSMGPQTTASINPTGLLSLIGTAAQPAKITGEAGGGYGLTVNGALAANNFVVKEMGPGGMVVGFPATIAVAPNNFRNGTFDFRAGSPAGSVLLDMRRQAPAGDFDNIVFLDTPGAASVFNVKTDPTGLPISFTNATGALADPSFENDPNNLIAWNTQPAPGVAFFKVRSGAERVEVLWRAANQANLTGFQVYRALAAAGPFSLVTTQGPGTPGNGFVDLPLAANQPVFEAVYATMTQGESVLFGSGTATPYSSAPPPNVKKVGGNGPFSDIQSAINASTDPNSVVWVTPGAYAAFSIGAGAPTNLHVLGDGTGPVSIDTSSGPVQISNIPAGNGVELSDLTIGSATTGQPGVVVTGCAGTIVLDSLGVACNGAQTAMSVAASTQVAVQRCAIQGGTGLSVTGGSHVALSRGSLTSLVGTTSTIEMASLTPGSVNVTPAGSLQTRGLMPDLNLPEFASMAHPLFLTVDAFPNSPFIVVASPKLGYTNFPQFEMPVLVDLVNMATLAPMFTDFAGFGINVFEIEPIASILGFSFVVQVGCLDPVSGVWRFSNVETMVAMP